MSNTSISAFDLVKLRPFARPWLEKNITRFEGTHIVEFATRVAKMYQATNKYQDVSPCTAMDIVYECGKNSLSDTEYKAALALLRKVWKYGIRFNILLKLY